jgi:SAM-dependent methyltransferase
MCGSTSPKSWYEEMYAHEDRHWWFVGRRRIVEHVIASLDLVPRRAEQARIIEIGCGTGGNLAMLSRFGRLSALEPDADAREMANSRQVCRVRDGAIPDRVPLDRRFDLACMLDVLEYIDEELRALARVREMLKPGGSLLITVPAYQRLWSSHDLAVRNKRRYSRSGLLDVTRRSGLAPVFSTHFNAALLPLIAGVRLAGTTGESQPESDIVMPPQPVNALLRAVLAAEASLLPALPIPFGLSILLVARRSAD